MAAYGTGTYGVGTYGIGVLDPVDPVAPGGDVPVAGRAYALTYYARDTAGNLTDVTAVTSTALLDPAGSLVLNVPGPAVRVGVGTYRFPAVTMPAAGAYLARTTFTDSGTTFVDDDDSVLVYGLGGQLGGNGQLVSIEEVKRHLNTPEVYTADDLELLLHIEAAIDLVEEHVGPVRQRTLTTTTRRGTTLLEGRVLSVLSVSPAVPYTLNAAAGLLDTWHAGASVTYTVGMSPVPAAVKLGVLEVIRALWSSQRGSFTPRFGEGEPQQFGELLPSSGDRLPPAALRLLRPYARGSAVA